MGDRLPTLLLYGEPAIKRPRLIQNTDICTNQPLIINMEAIPKHGRGYHLTNINGYKRAVCNERNCISKCKAHKT